MFFAGDIVRITIQHPVGAEPIKTLNLIGMVNEVIKLTEKDITYHVLIKHGEFSFSGEELELATEKEIKNELQTLIRTYYKEA